MIVIYDAERAVWHFVVERAGYPRVAGCALSFQEAYRCARAVAFMQVSGRKQKGKAVVSCDAS